MNSIIENEKRRRFTRIALIVILISIALMEITAFFVLSSYKQVKAENREINVIESTSEGIIVETTETATETTTEAPETISIRYIGEYNTTAYCSCYKCCGKTDGITASGTKVKAGRTVAMKGVPYGTHILIDGHEYVVEDTGGFKNNTIDIYFDTHQEALNYGRQKKEVYIIE